MMTRKFSPFDHIALNMDQALRTVFGRPQSTERDYPAKDCDKPELSDTQASAVASLMRINHVGEVCAQALYQGQALTARTTEVRESMRRSAEEENDHLLWCEKRIDELGSHKSYLNPLWYAGAFSIGATAGLIGDKWSLGFVAETEHQVVKHLDEHLKRLPENDTASHAILSQMKDDESHHETVAINAGAAKLPLPIKKLMTLASKVMTTTASKI